MTAPWGAIVGAWWLMFAGSLTAGALYGNTITWPGKVGIILVSALVGAALGRVALKKR